MGSLSQVVIPVEDVPISDGQTLTVRGLSYTDFSEVYVAHAAAAEEIAKMFTETKEGEFPPFEDIVKKLITEFSDVAAEIIAIANDEPGQVAVAYRLPAVVQTRALLAVIRLTLHSQAEVKKIVQEITQGMIAAEEIRWMRIDQTVGDLIDELPATGDGFGAFEDSSASS